MFFKKFAFPKFLLYWLKFCYIIALFYLFGLLVVRIYDQQNPAPYDTPQTLTFDKSRVPGVSKFFTFPTLNRTRFRGRIKSPRWTDDNYLPPIRNLSTDFKVTKTAPISTEASGVFGSKDVPDPIWPEDSNTSDRILEQMRYTPLPYARFPSKIGKSIETNNVVAKSGSYKVIYVYSHLHPSWDDVPYGKQAFVHMDCPVRSCHITDELEPGLRHDMAAADAVLFRNSYPAPHLIDTKTPGQIWIFHSLESPYYMQYQGSPMREAFNWTATYRFDSDIVTPYSKYSPNAKFNASALKKYDYDLNVRPPNVSGPKFSPENSRGYDELDVSDQVGNILIKETKFNYASNKSLMVAWFVSNCDARERFDYAKELQRHIQVDIYGRCGPFQCGKDSKIDCFKMLDSRYKFYLSFENSRCKDYITEKFFENGLSNKILPVVMGPSKGDYAKVAPHQSFIHVDDFPSPAHLAKFLKILHHNDRLYNSFLAWKELEKGSFIDTKFWCRLCAMLHHPRKNRSYQNLNEWWGGPNICKKP